jgi:hypothetical protein
LETRDANGSTPYLLALKLARTRAAHMLVRAGSCAKVKTPLGWEAHQVAAMTANPDLVRTAVVSMLKELDLAWERRIPKHLEKLRAMPDFTMTMSWDFTSWVPLVSTLLPRDTVVIRKRGTALRIDSTLLGFSGMSWGRGSISFLIQGEEQGNPGAWFVMDNDMRTAANARAALTNPPDHTIQDWVRKLSSDKQKRTKWNGAGVRILPELSTAFFGLVSGEQKVEDVGAFKGCRCFTMTGLTMAEWQHPPVFPAGLKNDSWWLPHYSIVTRRMPLCDRHPGIASKESAGGTWPEDDGISAPTASGDEAEVIAKKVYGGAGEPEAGMASLHSALESVKEGEVGGESSSSIATARSEFVDSSASKPSGAHEGIAASSVATGLAKRISPKTYFRGETSGMVMPDADEMHNRGTPGQVRLDLLCPGVHVFPDPTAPTDPPTDRSVPREGLQAVADVYEANLKLEEKAFSGRILMCKDFPLDKADMLPLAEVMVSRAVLTGGCCARWWCLSQARNGKHFATMKRFFETRLPDGEGFPVQFSIPVFPTVTVTVKMQAMDLSAPEEHWFVVPADYKMGAYVERTVIRQL